MESYHHAQRDRSAGQKFLAEHQHNNRDEPESQHGDVCIGDLAAEDGDALEEELSASFDPEQFRQLGHGNR